MAEDRKPVLLIFRVTRVTCDAYWGSGELAPAPEDYALLAISGGMPDFWDRQKIWADWSDGIVPNPSPFLQEAPQRVVVRVVWSLLGPGGRLYPIYLEPKSCLNGKGIDTSDLGAGADAFVSPKFTRFTDAEAEPWTWEFFCCISDGLACGFWGQESRLEQKLKKAPYASRDLKYSADHRRGVPTPYHERVTGAHPYLAAILEQYGIEGVLDQAQLVVRPWGWECCDALSLTKQMTQDEMVRLIRKELGSEMEILELEGDEAYSTWVSERKLDR